LDTLTILLAGRACHARLGTDGSGCSYDVEKALRIADVASGGSKSAGFELMVCAQERANELVGNLLGQIRLVADALDACGTLTESEVWAALRHDSPHLSSPDAPCSR
jgi:hypothetical protein